MSMPYERPSSLMDRDELAVCRSLCAGAARQVGQHLSAAAQEGEARRRAAGVNGRMGRDEGTLRIAIELMDRDEDAHPPSRCGCELVPWCVELVR